MKSVIVGYFKQRHVPKEFLQPRPMSGQQRPRHALLGYLSVEILAVILGALIGGLAPLRSLDERWLEFALQRSSRSTPPKRLMVVEVSPELSKSPTCGAAITGALTLGGARAGLMLAPLAELCAGAFDAHALDSELAPPVEALSSQAFRLGASSRIVGLAPAVEGSPLLTALGVRPAPWVAGRALDAIPAVTLDELINRNASPALLTERIVILALADSSTSSESSRAAWPQSCRQRSKTVRARRRDAGSWA